MPIWTAPIMPPSLVDILVKEADSKEMEEEPETEANMNDDEEDY